MKRIALALSMTAALAASMAKAGDLTLPGGVKVDTRTGAVAAAPGAKGEKADEAACSVAVPAGVTVVKGPQVLVQNDVKALVCPGAQVTVTANNATLYIAGEADVSVAGNSAKVYAHGAGRLAVAGNSASVYTDKLALTVVSGDGSKLLQCQRVILDMSAVPSGC
ncbi:MAG: hypothetical protein RIT28_2922 [Pseudomonadota bacterium]